MAELKWHNTRKSQFLVIARIMPFFVFLTFYIALSAKILLFQILKILQEGGTMSKKKEKQYTVVAIGKLSIENLTDTEARVFYKSILSCILEKRIDSKNESEEK